MARHLTFLVDELSSTPVMNRFLQEILTAGGRVRVRIAAYAIGTKPADQLGGEVRRAYERAKLDEDLALTPAA